MIDDDDERRDEEKRLSSRIARKQNFCHPKGGKDEVD
jgi:hypothetical protein